MENQNVAGGWTPNRPLEDEDLKVFEQAFSGFVGVKYTPLEVSTQIVAGTNYRFICRAETMTATPVIFHAEVCIFKPLQGDPCITQIVRLENHNDIQEKGNVQSTYCILLPAGPLWSNDDAQQRAPFICAAHGGRFTGKWFTTVWGHMSVVECELPYPQDGDTSFKLDVPAGPIWSNDDAKHKCDAICASYGGKWTGQWRTIVNGKMSVCECEFNW